MEHTMQPADHDEVPQDGPGRRHADTVPPRSPADEAPRRGPHRIAGRLADGQDARSRIQAVALELFIEHGYEQTSLREIADRLGVSKAALYYHFPTKEAIVDSLVASRIEEIDSLVAWLREQPRTLETRREFIHRYCEFLQQSRHHEVMRFFERNQTSMGKFGSGKHIRNRMMELFDLLSEPTAPLAVRLRRTLALLSLHAVWFMLGDVEATDDERRSAALEVALDLIGEHDTDEHGTAG